jgi:hypothetical protein
MQWMSVDIRTVTQGEFCSNTNRVFVFSSINLFCPVYFYFMADRLITGHPSITGYLILKMGSIPLQTEFNLV